PAPAAQAAVGRGAVVRLAEVVPASSHEVREGVPPVRRVRRLGLCVHRSRAVMKPARVCLRPISPLRSLAGNCREYPAIHGKGGRNGGECVNCVKCKCSACPNLRQNPSSTVSFGTKRSLVQIQSARLLTTRCCTNFCTRTALCVALRTPIFSYLDLHWRT